MKFGETPSVIKETKIGEKIDRDDYFFERENDHNEVYLKSILKDVKNPEAKEFLLDSEDGKAVQAVLYGVKPACWLNEKTAKLVEENISLSADFIIQGNILFNKHLVLETVKNNPDYFQDQELDANSIIDNYCNSGKSEDQVSVQVGLLLGFPKKASEDYQRFNKKTRNLHYLQNIIPQNSSDSRLLEELAEESQKHMNEKWDQESECPIIPEKIKEQVKYLLYKYLPNDEADLSWKRFQGKKIRIGGIVWMEWQSTPESEELKKKYRLLFDNVDYKIAVEEEMDNLCRELVNKNVLKTLDERNIIEIKNLAKHIKSKYSDILKIIKLPQLLSLDYNRINGEPINSADDLIEYLKMQKEVYEKELK